SAYAAAPHHVLPPASAMFAQFAASQLLPRATEESQGGAGGDAPADDEGSDRAESDQDEDAMDVDAPAAVQPPVSAASALFASALQRGFAH
ncbi:hypothetical protein GGI05_006828, partial [Coemansia sp. RSA 2603]